MNKENGSLKGSLVLPAVIIVALAVSSIAFGLAGIIDIPVPVQDGGVKKFSSYQEMKSFIDDNTLSGGYWGGFDRMAAVPMAAQALGTVAESADSFTNGGAKATDYSTTNIQVEGVDEADIVKNDGKYIYTVSGRSVVIVDARPAEDMRVLSQINLSGSVSEIFINGDRLVVFGQEDVYYYNDYVGRELIAPNGGYVPRYNPPKSFIQTFDVSDRSSPVIVKNISVDGSYIDSRMIGDYVYAIVTNPVYRIDPIPLPVIEVDGMTKRDVDFRDVYYFDNPDYSYTFTTILSLNVNNDGDVSDKTYLTGYTQNIYVSMDNIYTTYSRQFSPRIMFDRMLDEVISPSVPPNVAAEISAVRLSGLERPEKEMEIAKILMEYSDSLSREEIETLQEQVMERYEEFYKKIEKDLQKTIIHRIAISEGNIEPEGEGDVPGYVLNQFSMDENDGYFRIATTTRASWFSSGQSESKNHVYVLDMDLNIVGKVEDLAPGESIYSARFLGDRGYMVTFRKIDPLFVIDLSDPANPRVLGKLKIPGYSDYLHPYDDDHIIGLGKEAIGAEEGNFAWYQGVKLALFDVSDVENPREVSKFEVGDRGTESYALDDHKAFLFDREKKLLVIPITLAELDPSKYDGEIPDWQRGDYVWQGAYVFSLNIEDGFQLRGRITHVLPEDQSLLKSGYYYYSPYSVKRSLYMDDVLYTLSDEVVKANSLSDLTELGKLDLPEIPGRGDVYPIVEGISSPAVLPEEDSGDDDSS
jgi:uncharacterized secreted protein with C-terminal beta-propeller domain